MLESVTTAPPAGAGPYSVTVPVNEAPPVNRPGVAAANLSDNAVSTGATLRNPKFPPWLCQQREIAQDVKIVQCR